MTETSDHRARWAEALLRERAWQLAQPRDTGAPTEPTQRAVVCALGEALYAVPVEAVARIATYRPPARLPGGHAALLGVIARSGGFWHIYDLGVLLGATAAAKGFFVLLRGRGVGLRADAVLGVSDLAPIAAEDASQMAASPSVATFARATEAGAYDGRIISILDLTLLLPREAASPDHGEDTRVDR